MTRDYCYYIGIYFKIRVLLYANFFLLFKSVVIIFIEKELNEWNRISLDNNRIVRDIYLLGLYLYPYEKRDRSMMVFINMRAHDEENRRQ